MVWNSLLDALKDFAMMPWCTAQGPFFALCVLPSIFQLINEWPTETTAGHLSAPQFLKYFVLVKPICVKTYMFESYQCQLLDYQVLVAFDLENGVFFSLVGIGGDQTKEERNKV